MWRPSLSFLAALISSHQGRTENCFGLSHCENGRTETVPSSGCLAVPDISYASIWRLRQWRGTPDLLWLFTFSQAVLGKMSNFWICRTFGLQQWGIHLTTGTFLEHWNQRTWTFPLIPLSVSDETVTFLSSMSQFWNFTKGIPRE